MRRSLLVTLVTALVIGIILTGCASSQPSPSSAPPTSAPTTSPATSAPGSNVTEIRLGGALPLTGQIANLGLGTQFGLKTAVDDINALGGVMVADLGKKLPLKLTIVDSQSDPNQASTLSENLIVADKINFLISGDDVPPDVASMAPKADKYKIPYVVAEGPLEPYNAMRTASNPPWQYTWAIGFAIATPAAAPDFRAGQAGYTIMDLENNVLNQFAGQTNKKVALFASDDADGRGWYAAAGPVFQQNGIAVVGMDKELGIAPLDTTDFSPIIKQWIAADAQMLWGVAPAPWFGTLWRQSYEMGFHPKMVWAAKAGLYYPDVNAWGGNLPNGVVCEAWWYPTYQDSPGFGTRTPQTLNDAWIKASNQPFNQGVGHGYTNVQILVNAIEKAGSLNADKVNAALAQTDIKAMAGRVMFEQATHFSRMPLFLTQWQKSSGQFAWQQEVVVSPFSFIPQTAKPLFPIPY
jgi:branched-chain amino acid transport system substrate-binding protein